MYYQTFFFSNSFYIFFFKQIGYVVRFNSVNFYIVRLSCSFDFFMTPPVSFLRWIFSTFRTKNVTAAPEPENENLDYPENSV